MDCSIDFSIKKWQIEGKAHLTVSINLSPIHFLSTTLPDFLLNCTKTAGIAPQSLILEITENVTIEDRDAAKIEW